MKKNRTLHLSVVAIPILVIAGWIASYILHVEKSATFELPVRGFDPRDLLSGHYLRYQVEYGTRIDCNERSPAWCLCLDSTGGKSRATWQGECSDAPCEVALRGSCRRGQFVAGIEQFFFSEQYTKELAIVPPESSIVVSVSGTGKGVVKEFLVGGEPLKDWLESKAVTP